MHPFLLSIASTASKAGSITMQGTALLLAATSGDSRAAANEYAELFFSLRWAVMAIIVLVFTDFWSGLAASVRVRHEDFHFSRAGRRTLVKFGEYIAIIILVAFLAKSILQPLGIATLEQGGAIAATIVLLLEADSITGHICDLHGIKSRFSIKRLIVAYLKKKDNDLGEALEDSMGQEGDTTKNMER